MSLYDMMEEVRRERDEVRMANDALIAERDEALARVKELEGEKALSNADWERVSTYWMRKSKRLSSDLDAARRTIRSLMDEKRPAYRRAGE